MAIDLQKYRTLFPHVSRGIVYLNHAAIGPYSRHVVKAVEDLLYRCSETEIEVWFEFQKTIAETKDLIGRLINTTRDRIAFVDNTTNGLNLLAAGMQWAAGDRILLNDMEFPANVYPFLNLKRHGVEIDFIRNRDSQLSVHDIERAITPRTRLLSISHVQFFHGFRVDLEAVGDLCQSRGITFCVDAIQSAGVIPVDVRRMKVDFLSCGGQKWLLAPQGIAFIYLTEDLQSRLAPAYLGWTSIKNYFDDFFRYRLELEETARRYENGALNFLGIAGLQASLSMLLEVTIEEVEAHVRSVIQHLIERVKALGLPIVSPEDPHTRAGIVTFRVPDGARLFETLKVNNVQVSLRETCIRISPHFYNTVEEIDQTIDVLQATLRA